MSHSLRSVKKIEGVLIRFLETTTPLREMPYVCVCVCVFFFFLGGGGGGALQKIVGTAPVL